MTAESTENTMNHTVKHEADSNEVHASGTNGGARETGLRQRETNLSRISAVYDVNGDGVLDEAERAMRNMDTSGRGYLTNEKVYGLMEENLKMQKDLFKFKKLIIGLAVFVVLLTLCNLGTSTAAAFLAKDTATNDNSELVDVKTHEAVSTQTTADVFDYTRVYNETEGRRLGSMCSNKNGVYTCDTQSYLTMPINVGRLMIKKCKKGLTVDLRRVWHDESETLINLCPSMKGTFSQRKARFLNGVTLTISENGKFYELDGDALTQDEDDVCDETSDCDTGLDCMDDQDGIDDCKRRCDLLRFGPSRLQPCYDACIFRSCQVSFSQD